MCVKQERKHYLKNKWCDEKKGFFGKPPLEPCQKNPCVPNPCKIASSRCVPVEAGSIIFTSLISPGVICTNPSLTYLCMCAGTDFANGNC